MTELISVVQKVTRAYYVTYLFHYLIFFCACPQCSFNICRSPSLLTRWDWVSHGWDPSMVLLTRGFDVTMHWVMVRSSDNGIPRTASSFLTTILLQAPFRNIHFPFADAESVSWSRGLFGLMDSILWSHPWPYTMELGNSTNRPIWITGSSLSALLKMSSHSQTYRGPHHEKKESDEELTFPPPNDIHSGCSLRGLGGFSQSRRFTTGSINLDPPSPGRAQPGNYSELGRSLETSFIPTYCQVHLEWDHWQYS